MIVLEGPDLAGKTTLAEFLSRQLIAPIIHLGVPPPTERHWDQATHALLTKPLNAIYDRLVIGSIIYGPMMKDKAPVTHREMVRFQRTLALFQGVVIFCDAPDGLLRERYGERGDAYVTLPQILDAARQYRTLGDLWKYSDDDGSVLRYFSDAENPASFWERNRVTLIHASRFPRPPDVVTKQIIASTLLGVPDAIAVPTRRAA